MRFFLSSLTWEGRSRWDPRFKEFRILLKARGARRSRRYGAAVHGEARRKRVDWYPSEFLPANPDDLNDAMINRAARQGPGTSRFCTRRVHDQHPDRRRASAFPPAHRRVARQPDVLVDSGTGSGRPKKTGTATSCGTTPATPGSSISPRSKSSSSSTSGTGSTPTGRVTRTSSSFTRRARSARRRSRTSIPGSSPRGRNPCSSPSRRRSRRTSRATTRST